MKIKVLKTEMPKEFGDFLHNLENLTLGEAFDQLASIMNDEKNSVEVEITDVKYKTDDDTDEDVSPKFGDTNDQLVLPGEKS